MMYTEFMAACVAAAARLNALTLARLHVYPPVRPARAVDTAPLVPAVLFSGRNVCRGCLRNGKYHRISSLLEAHA